MHLHTPKAQRTVEFYLHQLAYGWNLISEEPRCAGRTHAVSPLDLLDAEVMRLDRYGDLSHQLLQRVELRLFWTVGPVGISLPPLPSILPSASAIQWIREHRFSAGPELLWIFTDGSVDQRCASTATGLNGNGRFNGTGTAVAPVSVAASAGNRCSCR